MECSDHSETFHKILKYSEDKFADLSKEKLLPEVINGCGPMLLKSQVMENNILSYQCDQEMD